MEVMLLDKVQLVSGLQELLVLGVIQSVFQFVQIQLHGKKLLQQQHLQKKLLDKQIYLLQMLLNLVLVILFTSKNQMVINMKLLQRIQHQM